MNNARRKLIHGLKEKTERLEAALEGIREDINDLKDQEEEALSNMPESLEGSERYSISEEALSNLDEASNSADEALDAIGSMIVNLEDATI